MAVKRKLSKAAFEKLSESLQSLYMEKSGEYFLDVEGDGDGDALKRAKDREKEARKAAEVERDRLRAERDELKRAADDKKDDALRKAGDVDALEKSWQEKYTALETKLSSERDTYKNKFESAQIDSISNEIGALSTKPKWLARDARERLQMDYDSEGNASIRVLGADGKPSAMTVDELKEEFLTNKEYSDIIIASKASGGATGTGGGSAVRIDTTKNSLADVSAEDLVAHIKAKNE